jgi:hypothetical protein
MKRRSTLPFTKDANFIGRDHILEKLGRAFSDHSGHQRVGLWGLGGIG